MQSQSDPRFIKNTYVERTKEERLAATKPIIEKLNELQFNMSYKPIIELYKQLNKYVSDGVNVKINIPFPEAQRTIRGNLPMNVREEPWVRLEKSS